MEQKNEFMLVFKYEPNFDHQPTEAEMTEMHQQWGAFFGNIAGQGKLVSTHQLGYEGKQISSDKVVTDGIYMFDKQTLSGNMIITAESITEATELAKLCPIISMGGSIEVRSIIPM
jgi:hypothetical protein